MMRATLRAACAKFNPIIICILSTALGFSLAANIYQGEPGTAIAAKEVVTSDWRDVITQIAEQLSPSVVNITSEKMVNAPRIPKGFEDFFFGPFGRPDGGGNNRQELTRANGSGVIVKSDGYILTNDHVVGGADRVIVKLNDGREFKGTVLRDPRTDLALVKIDAKDLPAAEMADSDKVKVGQWVVAIGNPLGLTNTVTVGVVSGLSREFAVPDSDNPLGGTYYPDAIQTDASINPGNSGGPLVDINGKVIGINSAIWSRTGGNMGIGFAVPSNTAKYVMDQLISKGKVVRGYLGLLPEDLTPVLSQKLGTKEGALVESVDKGSPAEKGGLQVKDVIIKINGKPVKNAVGLRRIVQAIKPGTEVEVVLIRDKKEIKRVVKVGEAPDGQSSAQTTEEGIGVTVQILTAEKAREIGVDENLKGVVVQSVKPGGAASRAGIQVNDVIMEIDNQTITSVAEFNKAVNALKKGDTAIVVVQRGDRSVILEMPVD